MQSKKCTKNYTSKKTKPSIIAYELSISLSLCCFRSASVRVLLMGIRRRATFIHKFDMTLNSDTSDCCCSIISIPSVEIG